MKFEILNGAEGKNEREKGKREEEGVKKNRRGVREHLSQV